MSNVFGLISWLDELILSFYLFSRRLTTTVTAALQQQFERVSAHQMKDGTLPRRRSLFIHFRVQLFSVANQIMKTHSHPEKVIMPSEL
jgi:hypothetical protein